MTAFSKAADGTTRYDSTPSEVEAGGSNYLPGWPG